MIEPGDPCEAARLDVAEAALCSRLPKRLRRLYEAGDGRFDTEGQWWVLWPLDRVVSETIAGWADAELPLSRELLAVGDDGTGNPFCVPTEGEDRVLRWSWIDGEAESEVGTLSDFAAEWLRSSA